MCNSAFLSLFLYNKHFILHKNTPHLKIICRFKNCGQHFNKYLYFKKHILRRHTTDYEKQSCVMYYCKEKDCNAYFRNSVNFNKHLYKHIRQKKIKLKFIVDTQFVVLIKQFSK